MPRKPASMIMLSLLVVSVLALAHNVQPVKASGTIYIRADGSMDPPTAPISTLDNATYIVTDNIINDSIVVERDNIVIDGAGYTLQGPGSGNGIDLSSRNNVTIKNMKITTFNYGIWLSSSSNNGVSGNNITNDGDGIYLASSNNNGVSGNNITNAYGGILLVSSSGNSVSGNNITNNMRGISLWFSSNNGVSGNNITANDNGGIDIESSSNNGVIGNNITNNGYGIYLYSSSNNNGVSGNNITNNGYGIVLSSSSDNSIVGNNVTANSEDGIYLISSSGSTVYHNNFINNTNQVVSSGSTIVWDDGYPSGGNYWGDYNGTDLYSGSCQNETGSDGIGDIPYIIDGSNRDDYPLMKPYPWTVHDVGVTNVATSKSVVCEGSSITVSVMVFGYGNGTEVVNIAISANQTIIGEINSVALSSRNFTIIPFTWDTTGFAKGNYTISAYAEPALGETDTSDNNFTGGWVIVSIAGDLTGGTSNPWDFVPDGKVDGKDITIVALCFGSAPGCPPPYVWNPNSEVNGDGKVDGKDIATVALHYGQADP